MALGFLISVGHRAATTRVSASRAESLTPPPSQAVQTPVQGEHPFSQTPSMPYNIVPNVGPLSITGMMAAQGVDPSLNPHGVPVLAEQFRMADTAYSFYLW